MAATFGYGKKTFIQGLARLACRVAKYITKYNAKLTANLARDSTALACITSIATCMNHLCGLLNRSDK